MKTYTVTAWNTYKIQNGEETGVKVIRSNYETITVSDAMDQAEADAKRWNKSEPALEVNSITCNGYIRTI